MANDGEGCDRSGGPLLVARLRLSVGPVGPVGRFLSAIRRPYFPAVVRKHPRTRTRSGCRRGPSIKLRDPPQPRFRAEILASEPLRHLMSLRKRGRRSAAWRAAL